jgi:SSS family transporter
MTDRSEENETLACSSTTGPPVNLAIDPFDAAIVLVYTAATVALGVWLARGQRTSADYFLGGRNLPGWAVLLSTVATETSTVTFLSIPGAAYAAQGDLRFLQITFGYILGRLVTAAVLLPLYFRGQPFTAYEVLESRFGMPVRRVASILFLVTRNLSDGLRLFLTALVLEVALGLDFTTCVIVLGLVTIVYTFLGGVKSVIWNDCLQFVVYLSGAGAALWVIIHRLPGGTDAFWQYANDHQKLRVFDWQWSFTKPSMTFWAGLIGGGFLTAATHGTDQLMVQRFLAARSQWAASWALVASGVVVCLQFALFLLIGVGLAAFYESFPPDEPFGPSDGDRVFAYFIVHHLGRGLVGLTLAAVFAAAMSTLSSSLNSSATALVNDLWTALPGEPLNEAQRLRWGRIATVAFGLLQVAIALASHQLGAATSVVKQVLAIAGFATGPTLGVYLLAVGLPRVGQRAALVGLVGGIVLLALIAKGIPLLWPAYSIYWPWYAAVGALLTLTLGWLFHVLFESHR